MKKNLKIIIPLVLLVAVAGAWYAYKEYNRKPASMENTKADFATNTATLIGAFEVNEAKANLQCLDKVVEVEGTIRSVSKDEAGLYTITLGDDGSLSSVRCSVDSVFSEQASELQPGGSITVRGVCTGFMADPLLGSDVTLVRCAILKK
ncbi:MAG: OB-fold protein [Bacteroidota bacterium]